MLDEYKANLKDLLMKIFQFDSADLDFGIYRIMYHKRNEIKRFINQDLIKTVEIEFRKHFNEEDLKNIELIEQHESEIFSHIYLFFSRYYRDGDFISQKRYSKQNKYIIPYNGEEFVLYWVNYDQYYIKTGKYYKNYSFKVDEYRIWFKFTRTTKDSEVAITDKRYFFLAQGEENVKFDEKKKELTILFEYGVLTSDQRRKYGRKNIQKAINDEIKSKIFQELGNPDLSTMLKAKKGSSTVFEWHLEKYTKKINTDFFIHKNLKEFLETELDFYIKNDILMLEDLDIEIEVNLKKIFTQIQIFKAISSRIIEFLAQVEDFQKKLFEKKKFIVKTDYCLTLDKIPDDFYGEIIQNKEQIREWKELYKLEEVDKGLKKFVFSSKSGLNIDIVYLKSHKFLVLDTIHFTQDFKDRLLSTFDDLEKEIGGILIKSENWQALNLILEKYKGTVKCIYIDPPYNTGNDGFIYKDNYQHSCWLTMMKDRLILAQKLLREDGVIFISIDDNEMPRMRLLADSIFGEKNLLSQIIWRKKYTGGKHARHFADLHDYIVVYGKDWDSISEFSMDRPEKQKEKFKFKDKYYETRGKYYIRPIKSNLDRRETLIYPIKCPDGTKLVEQWICAEETYFKLKKEGRILVKKKKDGNWQVYRKYYEKDGGGKVKIPSILRCSSNNEGKEDFKRLFHISEGREIPVYTIKPVALLSFLIGFSTEQNHIVLDFFTGTGSTGHAVLNLNRKEKSKRKYVLIEMADFFDTIVKTRMKKVMFSKDWQDGKPKTTKGFSHMFKYHHLEQFEDTLRNSVFLESGSVQKTLLEFDDDFIQYMLDFETHESPTKLNINEFRDPFQYKFYFSESGEIKKTCIDLLETFNYLLGLNVKQIKIFKNQEKVYRVVFGENQNNSILIIWRNLDGLNLTDDKKFIESKILPKFKAEIIYINGDNSIEKAVPVEPTFNKLIM